MIQLVESSDTITIAQPAARKAINSLRIDAVEPTSTPDDVACTVVLGMVLRRVAAEGTALSFVVVATTVLAVLLLGWRLVARLVA